MAEEKSGKTDLVTVLYIVGGIPTLVAFLVVIFTVARTCGIPA